MVRDVVASLTDVKAGYGGNDILNGVNLALSGGEIFALLGPNGAGKSTLTRVLTGVLQPRYGQVSSSSSEIGLVPQEIALYEFLSPRENCLAFAGLDGVSRPEASERAARALMLTGCVEVADNVVAKLSGGFRRRANIAVALMRQPTLLILDEPTAGLDADAKRTIQDVLLDVREGGACVLMITHDFEVVEAVADRVGIMCSGSFIAEGKATAVIEKAFGSRLPVEVILASEPKGSDVDALLRLGAAPTISAKSWLFMREQNESDASIVSEAIARLGMQTREIRFRQQNLQDAYQLTVHGVAK